MCGNPFLPNIPFHNVINVFHDYIVKIRIEINGYYELGHIIGPVNPSALNKL